jgi:hypothetical protein
VAAYVSAWHALTYAQDSPASACKTAEKKSRAAYMQGENGSLVKEAI